MTPSTGAIDYFLSLDVELEAAQNDYLEQMVRMDTVNTAYFKQVMLRRPPNLRLHVPHEVLLLLCGTSQ